MKASVFSTSAAALVFSLAANSFAAVAPATEMSAPSQEDVRISLDGWSAMEASQAYRGRQARASDSKIEIGAMSWQPSEFQLPSRISEASAYSSTSIPRMSLGWIKPVFTQLRAIDLSVRIAAGFQELSRSGNFVIDGVRQTGEQALYWLPLSVGAEIAPGFLRTKVLGVHAGFALLPSVALTQRSIFEDGSSAWGIPFEGSAGISSKLRFLGSSFSGAELVIDGRLTRGSLGGGSIHGSGVGAALRLKI